MKNLEWSGLNREVRPSLSPLPLTKDLQLHNLDAAATNLWAVYVAETERYDDGLVESWKYGGDAYLCRWS
jgi:hypothetical protein